ncbi:MAG: hypothetical protein GY776_07125 [Alteromonas sp.]|nr:hypothetical protein [Alteromonas sp.]
MSLWTDIRDTGRAITNNLSFNTLEQGVRHKDPKVVEAREEEARRRREDPDWKPEHTEEDRRKWAELAEGGSVLHTTNGPVTKSYGDWVLDGGRTGWKGFMQDVHGLSPDQFLSLPKSVADRLYRGEALGSQTYSTPEAFFEDPVLKGSEGNPENDMIQAATRVSIADRSVSQLFDREVLNPLLEGAGGNGLVQSAKGNAALRSARTVQDTNRTLSRRGTQLTPAQRMAVNNQLGLNNATNTTNSVNKAVVSQQDTNNKELNSLFELTSRERFANSKTINQLAGISAERAADNSAANRAYKNQRFSNTVSGALSALSMGIG